MLVTVSKSRTADKNKVYLLGNNRWIAKARTTARVIHLSTAVPKTGGSMNLPVFISVSSGYVQADPNVQPLLKSGWVSATLTGIADLRYSWLVLNEAYSFSNESRGFSTCRQ